MTTLDVSTHSLGDKTFVAMAGKVSLEDILGLWYATGRVIGNQLLDKKGVRLNGLGTFTLTSGMEPIFIMSSDLASQYKVKQKFPGNADNISTSMLNYSQLASEADVSRDVAEKVITKFVSSLIRSIAEGRNIQCTFHRVAEMTINRGELAVTFYQDYLSKFAAPAGMKTASNGTATRNIGASSKTQQQQQKNRLASAAAAESIAAANRRNRLEDGLQGQKINAGPNRKSSGNPPIQASVGDRARNPITGEFGSEISYKVPPPRARNPLFGEDECPDTSFASAGSVHRPSSAHSGRSMVSNGTRPSADTLSLLHSPRSQPSDIRGGYSGGGSKRHSSDLRRENLERHTAMQAAAASRRFSQGPTSSAGAGGARALAAKALDGGDIVEKLRRKIVERGGSSGIRGLGRLLSIMDDNGDKRLSKDELKFGLRDYGIDLTPTELEQLFMYFDRDGNGFIDFTEFLIGMRGDLSSRRKKIVKMAFDLIDTDGSGQVTADELAQLYDMKWNPDVRAGKKTEKEAIMDFMKQWDRVDCDGIVTFDEFVDYYKEISASIDDDDYFELMIRNAWRIAGGEGAAANTANKRVLVTNKDGSQSVVTINKELGMKQGNMNDIKARLAAQGVDGVNIELHGGVDATEKAKKDLGRLGNMRGNNPISNSAQVPPAPPAKVPSSKPISNKGGDVREERRPGSSSASLMPPAPPLPSPRADNTLSPNSPFEIMRRIIYTPPCSIEQLAVKLAVSVASTCPRIAQGAFMARFSTLDSSLRRPDLLAIWKEIDPANKGSIELGQLHEMLQSRFGKDKSSAKNTGIIERVINKILERSGSKGGIKGLTRTLAIMDTNGDKRLTKEEIKYGLQDYGIDLNIRELDEIFNYFDRDRSGFIDTTEFLVGVMGDLNDRRMKLVRMAFEILDKDGSGEITVDELLDVYDVSKAPEVLAGKKTEKEAIMDFMKQWDRDDGNGIVTFDEFVDYYKEISASIDGDDYFELMIRNAWRIAGGEGAAANTANKRVLVTNKDGSQSVVTINKELGMKQGNMNDIKARLAAQGVDGVNIELHGGVDATEKAKKTGGLSKATSTARAPGDRMSSNAALKAKGGSATNVASSKNLKGVATSNTLLKPGDRGGAGGAIFSSASVSHTTAPSRNAFDRNVAAMKLAAAFRGRMARKEVAQMKRYEAAKERERAEIEAENNRPKPPRLIRPKGKSSLGF